MGWFIAMTVLLFVLALIVSGHNEERAFEELHQSYPEPTATVTPLKVLVRYPVPLDDDMQRYVQQVCSDYQVAPAIVFAMMAVESNFQSDAVGDGGNSIGIMQIYRSVHEQRMERLGVVNLYDPKQNVRVGIDFMAELLNMGDGSYEWALSYYSGNGGSPCNYARTVMRMAECFSEGVQILVV